MKRQSARITEEVADYILANYKGISCRTMAQRLEEKFGEKHNECQMWYFYKKHHLVTGVYESTRFKKGNPSPNKGKPMTAYMSKERLEKFKAHQFKKGQDTYNQYPKGTMLKRHGRMWIKVDDKREWTTYARYVWEKETGKKVPSDMFVGHLDKDGMNDDIDNLILIRDVAMPTFNKYYKPTGDKDIDRAFINYINLRGTINKIERGNDEHN